MLCPLKSKVPPDRFKAADSPPSTFIKMSVSVTTNPPLWLKMPMRKQADAMPLNTKARIGLTKTPVDQQSPLCRRRSIRQEYGGSLARFTSPPVPAPPHPL